MESMAVVELNTQDPMEKKGETRVEITRRTSGLTDGSIGRNLAPAIKLDRDDVPHRVSLLLVLLSSFSTPSFRAVTAFLLAHSRLAIRRDSLGAKEIQGSEYE